MLPPATLLASRPIAQPPRSSRIPIVARGADGPSLDAPPVVLSHAMRRLYKLAERAARARLPVLVLGPTGSGKELIARSVHASSGHRNGPFSAINCAAIPPSLIESLLFGHERGAFTGAERQSPGIFEVARGGSVFLDEVGELSLPAQAALLRVLEQRRLVRVGGVHEIAIDVRVIAATHRDLSAMVAQGSFRDDLLFRLQGIELAVPPLRERSEEIAPLAERFLRDACESWGAAARGFAPDVVAAFHRYAWPGNVRQLRNVVEHAAALASGEVIQLCDLPAALQHTPASATPSQISQAQAAHTQTSESRLPSLAERVKRYERELIAEALERTQGSHRKAAELLGLPRRTLAHKVHQHGLAAAGDKQPR